MWMVKFKAYFELSPDQTSIIREVYTFLDMLSDVGGVQGILISIFNLGEIKH